MFCFGLDNKIDKLAALVRHLQRTVEMNQTELAQKLTDLKTQNEKAAAEQAAALQALKDALANAGSTTPEVDAALAALATSIQAEDDLNPDTPAP